MGLTRNTSEGVGADPGPRHLPSAANGSTPLVRPLRSHASDHSAGTPLASIGSRLISRVQIQRVGDALSYGRPLSLLTPNQRSSGAARRGLGAGAAVCLLLSLRNVLAPFDATHQPLELLRWLGAKIGVVHTAKLFSDGKQGLGPQADNFVLRVVPRHGHCGSAHLGTH